jgi:DNA-binding IscR family transcriptional regulator
MTCIGQRFQRGLPAPTIEDMSSELGIPSRLVQQVLQTLIAARLVIEISGADAAYTPARPLEAITAHHVLMAMRATQGQELVTRDEPVRQEVYGEFARIQEAEKQAASAITMLELVHRAETRLQLTPPPPDEEIKVTHALVPHPEHEPKAAPAPPAPEPIEVPAAPEPVVAAMETPAPPPEPRRPVQHAAGIAEPASDEDREFPL